MPYNESQKLASYKYRAKSIRRISLEMQHDQYNDLKIAAERAGEPVNKYIKIAIKQRINHDNEQSGPDPD